MQVGFYANQHPNRREISIVPISHLVTQHKVWMDSRGGVQLLVNKSKFGGIYATGVAQKMKLFGWGTNSSGQLGLNETSEQCCLPVELKTLPVSPDDIALISGGGSHSVLVTKQGLVYSCGSNNVGQLGNGHVSPSSNTIKFEPVIGLERVTAVACGWDFNIALTQSGDVVGWGSNVFGQLGLPSSHVHVPIPTRLPLPPLVLVSAGLRHCAGVLPEKGQVLTWGLRHRKKQRDNTDAATSCSDPVILEGLSDVRKVECGQYHTLILKGNGEVWFHGDNRFGQSGRCPQSEPYLSSPIRIQVNYHVQDIATGWTHCLALTDRRQVLTWGRHSYGQLGRSSRHENFDALPSLLSLNNIKQFAAGSEHSLALSENGRLWSWGWNEHSNCGNGNIQDVFEPQELSRNFSGPVVQIGVGAGHNFVLVQEI